MNFKDYLTNQTYVLKGYVYIVRPEVQKLERKTTKQTKKTNRRRLVILKAHENFGRGTSYIRMWRDI